MNDPWIIFEKLAHRAKQDRPIATDIAQRVMLTIERQEDIIYRPFLYFSVLSASSAIAILIIAFNAYDLASDPLLHLLNPENLFSF
jgi:hypothetical protein